MKGLTLQNQCHFHVSTDSQEIRVVTPHELYPHAMEVTLWETLSDTFDLLITCATVEAYFGILSIKPITKNLTR